MTVTEARNIVVMEKENDNITTHLIVQEANPDK